MNNHIEQEREIPIFGSLYTILDSSLISRTNRKKYDVKVVDLGEYTQVYLLENTEIKRNKVDDFDLKLKKEKINGFFEEEKQNYTIDSTIKNTLKEIESKNIIRSKLECQRLAKANSKKWETFITLTFKENIIDIKLANKKFQNYVRQVKRVFKEFSYIAIPEFQKRGAIHYHLLTNIPADSPLIPKREIKRLYNKEIKCYKELEYYDLKYWNYGFSSAEVMKGNVKKVIGYISKYMTKDIDNRLFGKHRYFYSQNLSKPKENYIDMEENKDKNYYKKIIQDKELIYQNEYINPYNGTKVIFLELFRPSKDSIT